MTPELGSFVYPEFRLSRVSILYQAEQPHKGVSRLPGCQCPVTEGARARPHLLSLERARDLPCLSLGVVRPGDLTFLLQPWGVMFREL